jgi:hypothetical protein
MTTENIKKIVELVIRSEVAKTRAEKVIASIEDKHNGIIIYLSHGATLGESLNIQETIKACGLSIPEQLGNAVVYITT